MKKYFDVLRIRNFSLVFFGQWVSNLGSNINYIGITLLTMKLSEGVLSLGILLVILRLPSIIFGPFAGILADRYNKKHIIIFADIIRGLLSLLMIYYYNNINGIFILMFLQAMIDVLFGPAIRSMIPRIVNKDHLVTANSMSATTFQISKIVGPALGGLLIGIWDIKIIFIINAFSFILSGFSEMFISYKHENTNVNKKSQFKSDFKEGISYILSNKLIKFVIIFFAVGSLAFGAIHVLNLAFLKQVLGLNDELYGLIMSIYSVGVILGSIVINKLEKKFNELQLMILGFGLFGTFYIVFSAVTILPVTMALFGLCGVSSALLNISYGVYLQKYVESSKLGRVFSIDIAIGNMILLMASALAGAIADKIGIQTLMLYSGIFLVIQSLFTINLKFSKSSIEC